MTGLMVSALAAAVQQTTVKAVNAVSAVKAVNAVNARFSSIQELIVLPNEISSVSRITNPFRLAIPKCLTGFRDLQLCYRTDTTNS